MRETVGTILVAVPIIALAVAFGYLWVTSFARKDWKEFAVLTLLIAYAVGSILLT